MERVELEVIAKTDKAEREIDELTESIKELNKATEDANEEQKSLGQEVSETGGAMAILDAATGGLASRVRDGAEAFKLLRGRLTQVTAAQLKANAAALANPYVILATAIVGATVAIGKYVEEQTDGAIPTTTTIKNMVLSLGDAFKFAQLQAEAYAEGLRERAIEETDRAIQVLRAFGENTIDLEIENAERRLEALKEGEEGYEEALTEIAVLRATKAKQLSDERAANEKQLAEERARVEQEAYQNKIKEIQLQEKLEAEAEGFDKEWQEEKGRLEGEAYANAFMKAKIEKEEELNVDYTDMQDVLDEEQIDNDMELVNKQLAEQQRLADGKKAIQENLGAMMSNIFGQQSKVGKAFAVAQAIRDTYVAANTALASAPPPFNFVAAASVIASGIANVKQITATDPEVEGGAVPSIPTRGISNQIGLNQTPNASSVGASGINQLENTVLNQTEVLNQTPNVSSIGASGINIVLNQTPNVSPVDASGISELTQTIQNQNQQPIKAYVVSSDVSTAQSLDRNKIESASI